ncbi:YALIA101S02e05512g1_1 [Yarrowia lipolytica]|nr:YALIA101S02e05512g1_1 [Yarrowia lipolytica]
MSSSKQPKANALRSRISAPPGSASSPRSAKRVASAGGVKKAATAKPTSTRSANQLKNNALFQAIKGIPRTSPTAPAQPAQPRPGQELRDRISGKTPAKTQAPPPAKTKIPAKPAHPLASRFGQPPLPKSKLDKLGTTTAPSHSRYNGSDTSRSYSSSHSSSSDNHRSTHDTSASSTSSRRDDKHVRGGGHDKYGNYDKCGNNDKFGRSQERYNSRERERYERTGGSDRAVSSDSRDRFGNGGRGNESRNRYNDQPRSQAQSYQESRERYSEDRVRYRATSPQKHTAQEAVASPAAYANPGDTVAVRPAAQVSNTNFGAKVPELSANGTPSYSIKHLAMPPIVQISNLDRGTTRDDLYKFFVELGAIRDCRILTLGTQGAMGEITFEDPEAAKVAFAKFNGALADGRRLVVNIVKYNSIADQKPVEVNNAVHHWPGAGNLRSDGYLNK